VAAHLRDAGLEVRVFGEVMEFWRRGMPAGMLLRSERAGSHIADPHAALTLEQYEADLGTRLPDRMPLQDFVAYGVWYQRKAVPEVDPRRVVRIEPDSERLRVVLNDGEVVRAERVVVATGLEGFAARPAAFAGLPPGLTPHASELQDPSSCKGLNVAVVGAGQSAWSSQRFSMRRVLRSKSWCGGRQCNFCPGGSSCMIRRCGSCSILLVSWDRLASTGSSNCLVCSACYRPLCNGG